MLPRYTWAWSTSNDAHIYLNSFYDDEQFSCFLTVYTEPELLEFFDETYVLFERTIFKLRDDDMRWAALSDSFSSAAAIVLKSVKSFFEKCEREKIHLWN